MRQLKYIPFIILISIFIFLLTTTQKTTLKDASYEDEDFEKEIASVGGTKAYKSLSLTLKNKSYGEQHIQSHNFGAALYKVEGLKGVKVCDEQFGYGCYHSYFEEAINDKGLSIIPALDKECTRQYTMGGSCQHGIGHGLLSHLGDEKLAEALEYCLLLPSKKRLSCEVGVFMEFNNRTMDSDKGIVIRHLDKANPYTPCDSLKVQFQSSCYFAQTSLWFGVYDYKLPAYGDLCDKLSNSNKRSCYLGIGTNATLSTNFSFQKTKELCDTLSTVYGKLYCRIGSSIAFLTRDNSNNKELYMCDNLNPADTELCKTYIATYISKF